VGVNKYQPVTEEKVEVLVIDNTKVRESQVVFFCDSVHVVVLLRSNFVAM
jgi:methylmalonyl-CoA mutase N-terminal domain/subunit